MKNIIALLLLLFIFNFASKAQNKYFTKSGTIIFDGKATLDKIHAENKSAACVLDAVAGTLRFTVLMKGFEFKKALMQTHFNEKYVESPLYPKSEFNGQIINNSTVKYNTDGVYTVSVKGKLTIHGQTKEVTASGKITVKNGKVNLNSIFTILVPDYKIKANMKDQVTISVDCSLDVLTN